MREYVYPNGLVENVEERFANHLLVKLSLVSGPLCLTDAPVALEYAGDSYLPSGHLLEAGSVDSSAELQVDDIDLVLSAVDLQMLALLAADHRNRPVALHRAWVDDHYQVAAVDDTYWAGIINNLDDEQDGESHTLTVNLTNHLATFEEPGGMQLTQSEHQARFPGDTGLRHALVADRPKGEWGHEDLAQGGGLFADKVRTPGMQIDLNLDASAQKLPIVFGRAAVTPTAVYRHITGQDKRYLCLVDAICVGPIKGIHATELMGLDIASAEGKARFGIDGRTGNGRPYIAYQDQRLGQGSHTAYPWLLNYPSGVNHPGSGNFPDFLASDTFEGMASRCLVLRNHKDGPYSGEPQRRYIVDGLLVWDPRDSAQQANDPTTWQWSANPALCVLHFLRMAKADGGWGLPLERLILDDYIEEANWIDTTLVTGSDGNERPVMSCNLVLDTHQGRLDNLRELYRCCRARPRWRAGKLGFAIDRHRPSVMRLDENDLVGAQVATPERDQRKNRITIEFTDGANGYVTNTATWPTPDDPEFDQYLADDLGLEQTDTIKCPAIDNFDEALQMAEVLCRRSRSRETGSWELPPRAAALEGGDVIEVTDADRGWGQRYFQLVTVTTSGSAEELEVHAELERYDPSIFTWRDKPLPPPSPDYDIPSPVVVPMPTGLAYHAPTDHQPQGRLTWDHDWDWTVHYDVVVFAGESRMAAGPASEGEFLIPPLTAGSYTVKVVRISNLGKASEPASFTFALTKPAAPVAAEVEAGVTSLVIRPRLASGMLGYSGTFNVRLNAANNFDSATYKATGLELTFAGLAPNTSYFGWAQFENLLGESLWFPFSATTTDGSELADLLRPHLDDLKSFTWFAWADNDQGAGFTLDKELGKAKAWMGTAANQSSPHASVNYQDYTWNRIRAEVGDIFTPEEQAQLDNLAQGRMPDNSGDLLALQAALANANLGNQWVDLAKLTQNGVTAAGLGGETPAGAQGRADAAKLAAEQYALAQANLAETKAKAHTDNQVNAEEARAIADAQAKAEAARQAAITAAAADAQAKANAANASAQSHADAQLTLYRRSLPDFFMENGLQSLTPNAYGATANTAPIGNYSQYSLHQLGEHGGKVVRAKGTAWFYSSAVFPVDTSKRYKVRFKVRQYDNGTGSRYLYAGVATMDKDLNGITGGSGTHRYCAASGINIVASQGWRTFEGYISGEGDAHNNFRPGTAYVRIMGIVNYSNGTGTADIDELSIHEVTEQGDLIAIGMETTAGAQSRADAAKQAAINSAAQDAQTKANNAKSGAVSDVAQGSFSAQTGLITSLMANSGLFNQLQAQLALFGGLGANSIAAGAILTEKLDVRARQLVNNFSQTGELTGWDGSHSSFPLETITVEGKAQQARKVTTSGNVQLTSDWFEIDHNAIYEVCFSIYRHSGGGTGTRYFGLYAANTKGGSSQVVDTFSPSTRYLVTTTSNPYFWYGDISNGQIRKMRAFIVGANANPESVPECENVHYYFRLKADQNFVCLRALNYYNAGVTTTDYWLHPSVRDISGGKLSAQQVIADQGMFNTLRSRIAQFGGITANELTVDNALITKLVGSSALFNQLMAQMATFGGVTANAIAADAIEGRHIKAGQKLESPVIAAQQYTLLGPNTMKVERETPFGPDGLIEWRGPKLLSGGEPDWNNLRKSNASYWYDQNNDSYHGGSLSAGVLKNGAETTNKNSYGAGTYPITLGPFGTNGRRKNVVVSFRYAADSTTSGTPSTSGRSLTYQLQRKIGSGSWVTLKTETISWTPSRHFEDELGRWIVSEYVSASSTYTDTNTSTGDFNYRILVSSHTRYHANSSVDYQILGIISTEQ
ncbi:phage tail protein [Ferrimonas sp.]|uniref:phage tail protein n=1 Tax=Ferrimonas sp. TaxID=2080861 RepID=UPI003A91E300